MKRTPTAVVSILVRLAGVSLCGPAPGDVFREYMWWNENGDKRRGVARWG